MYFLFLLIEEIKAFVDEEYHIIFPILSYNLKFKIHKSASCRLRKYLFENNTMPLLDN